MSSRRRAIEPAVSFSHPSTSEDGHGKYLYSTAHARHAGIEVGGFHHQDVRGYGVHDELRGVADEKPLEPGTRNHAHRDNGAALAAGSTRDHLVRASFHEMTMAVFHVETI